MRLLYAGGCANSLSCRLYPSVCVQVFVEHDFQRNVTKSFLFFLVVFVRLSSRPSWGIHLFSLYLWSMHPQVAATPAPNSSRLSITVHTPTLTVHIPPSLFTPHLHCSHHQPSIFLTLAVKSPSPLPAIVSATAVLTAFVCVKMSLLNCLLT